MTTSTEGKIKMKRCRHGMIPEYCAHCNIQENVPRKVVLTNVIQTISDADFQPFVTVQLPKKNLLDLREVGVSTRRVHVTGFLPFWVLEAISEQAPNLEMIRAAPSAFEGGAISQNHFTFCSERGITLVSGFSEYWTACPEGRSMQVLHEPGYENHGDVVEQRDISPERLIMAVCEYFNVSQDDLLGDTRFQHIAWVRQVAMYLVRELLGFPWLRTAAVLHRGDHTTAIHAHRRVEAAILNDHAKRVQVQEVLSRLRHG